MGNTLGGGSAAQAGMDYQNRVAAWIATRILAERATTTPWDLGSTVTLGALWCETDQPVDDLLVWTSDNGCVFAQVKHTVRMGSSPFSAFGSAIGQFVGQFLRNRQLTGDTKSCERPLDSERDRLVLITSPTSSSPITHVLPTILGRVRSTVSMQTLESAAQTAKERSALRTLKGHITRCWQNITQVAPSDDDLVGFLSLVWVFVLDVDAGGSGEREAQDVLRTSVLHDPNQAVQAWNTLVASCAGYARERTGADRRALQDALAGAGITSLPARSYRNDIQRLRDYTRSTLSALSDHSKFSIGQREVRITRTSMQRVREATATGPVLVTGEPGAGKSGALHDLIDGVLRGGSDALLLTVDRIAADSLGELRNELGLDHELLDVIAEWHGVGTAYFVVDALDAARLEPRSGMLTELLAGVAKFQGRWKAVASMRSFDIRYSRAVQQVFAGSPPSEFRDANLSCVRHVAIPLLSDDEIGSACDQSPELAGLVRVAGPALRELLKVPFNLRLAADLLSAGASVSDLSPIDTQVELIERYWQARVIRNDGQGDAREAVLRTAAENMVTARQLRVARAVVADCSSSAALNDLLSHAVLSEWHPPDATQPERYVLVLGHHVLFDFAVARLMLRGDHCNLIQRLTSAPDSLLMIRPSVVFHFHYLWSIATDRPLFWDTAFEVVRANGVPEIAKLIGPSVAAELARALSDLTPLVGALRSTDAPSRQVAESTLRYLIGAILATLQDGDSGRGKLIGDGAGPWCDLLEQASQAATAQTAYALRSLLMSICKNPELLTRPQLERTGAAARRLLSLVLDGALTDRWLRAQALEAVCRTFTTDQVASGALIRRCMKPERLANHGYEEMPWLAREIGRLIPQDPCLAEDIYKAVFSYEETRRDAVPMGGRILAFTTTPAQDWEMAQYHLGEQFPAFLKSAPVQATRALIAAVESHLAERESRRPSADAPTDVFDFDGREARVRADHSCIWDAGDTHRHNPALKMLDALEAHLRQDDVETEERRQLVSAIVSENPWASVWRRLIIAATAMPNTLGQDIKPVAWAQPLLACTDTSHLVGDYLAVVFPMFTVEERARTERAILGLPERWPENRREYSERCRDLLLGCLPPGCLVTEEAKRRVGELAQAGGAPVNGPPFGPATVSWGSYSERDYLAERGVPVDAEPNRRTRELEEPVSNFAKAHLNTTPPAGEWEPVLPTLQALHVALDNADADGVHPEQRDHAWGVLAEACEAIARSDDLPNNERAAAFVRQVLLEAAQHPVPEHDPDEDGQFDDHASWGGGSVRVEAASGLIYLARNRVLPGEDIVAAVKTLARDPVPAVRFQVASRVNILHDSLPDLMWSLVEHYCSKERSRGVLHGLIGGPFTRLAGRYCERIAGLTKAVYEKLGTEPGAGDVKEDCIRIFLGLYLWQKDVVSHSVICGIAHSVCDDMEAAQHVLIGLRDVLAVGTPTSPDAHQDAARHRAVCLFGETVGSISREWRVLVDSHPNQPFNQWTKSAQIRAQQLVALADTASGELYFASGAHDANKGGVPEEDSEAFARMRRFYSELAPEIDVLANLSFPAIIHHLVETLEYLLPVDPAGIFLHMSRIVKKGAEQGYQYESLAVDCMVSLVQRCLAEFPHVFRESTECCQALVEVLDLFVTAGWPSAQRLSYRLEEIFR